LRTALTSIQGGGLTLRNVSRLYQTPAVPEGSGPPYVNACAEFGGNLPVEAVLSRLHAIEDRFGRRRGRRWGRRTLDLDLLAAGSAVLPDRRGWLAWSRLPPSAQRRRAPDRLILPHPRLHERGFVLLPLADIAPDWRHPVLGRSVAEMLAALPKDATAGIQPLD